MPTQQELELYKLKAEICKTFADPKRLLILNELRGGEKTVGDIAEALETPQAVISRHLAVLRSRGVVTPRREGINVHYRLTNPKISEACDIIHQVLVSQIGKNKELAERLSV